MPGATFLTSDLCSLTSDLEGMRGRRPGPLSRRQITDARGQTGCLFSDL
jgi:hypothetical protein